MQKIPALLSAIVCSGFLWAAPVGYPTPGQVLTSGLSLYAAGGDITAYYLGSEASYASQLWLNGIGPVLTSKTTMSGSAAKLGQSYSFGTFTPGTDILLRLDTAAQGNWGKNSLFVSSYSVFSGPASLNPDGLVHAFIESWSGEKVGPKQVKAYDKAVYVGFEDLLNGGDRDYNDYQLVVTGVSTARLGFSAIQAEVSEPWTLVTSGSALVLLMAGWRRRALTVPVPKR